MRCEGEKIISSAYISKRFQTEYLFKMVLIAALFALSSGLISDISAIKDNIYNISETVEDELTFLTPNSAALSEIDIHLLYLIPVTDLIAYSLPEVSSLRGRSPPPF